jgi:DNA mismatch endonuclease, patch repair protein
MAAIRSKDTKPELIVRSLLHSLGYRFRVHGAHLPGKPDVVLPKYRTALFVHGCFWHMHNCKYGRVTPRTNAEFWADKRLRTVERDVRSTAALRRSGWRVATVWECQTKDPLRLAHRLKRTLQLVPKD